MSDVKAVEQLVNKYTDLKTEISKKIIGQEKVVNEILLSIFAGGHALLIGVPGLAKTLMVNTISQALGLDFKRIQFTPDLMPSDILGSEILDESRNFKFIKGPVFSNIILADEINRTPPKTQAALLEAMQEFEVTYGDKTYPLDKPFFILATQNPIEQSGTFVLPEAQQDRFLLYIKIGYPTQQDEEAILKATTGTFKKKLNRVISGDDIVRLQQLVREVSISDALISFVSDIIRATRPETTIDAYVKDWVDWGAGPRAGQAMILTAKANALLEGRLAVTLDDIKAVALPVLRHRVLVNFRAEAEGITSDKVANHLLSAIQLKGK